MAFGYTTTTVEVAPKLRQTKKLRCLRCKPHRFQDKRYGRRVRVHNFSRQKGWRCSVCGNTRQK